MFRFQVACATDTDCPPKNNCDQVICPDLPCTGTKYTPIGECCPVCIPEEPMTPVTPTPEPSRPTYPYEGDAGAFAGPRVCMKFVSLQ